MDYIWTWNFPETFDSREIIERINNLTDDWGDGETYDEEDNELRVLKKIEELASDNPEWKDGLLFVRSDYFEEYAEQFAEDVGLLTRDKDIWPYNHIDWEKAANDLLQDYTEYEFDGYSYYARSY